MEIRKVKDLSDSELIEELNNLEEKLKAEYSILSTYKTHKRELIEEIEIRFMKNRKEDLWISTRVLQR